MGAPVCTECNGRPWPCAHYLPRLGMPDYQDEAADSLWGILGGHESAAIRLPPTSLRLPRARRVTRGYVYAHRYAVDGWTCGRLANSSTFGPGDSRIGRTANAP